MSSFKAGRQNWLLSSKSCQKYTVQCNEQSKMVKNEQDVVYIGIDEPAVVRKGLLEASKSLVHILKSQHNLLETRAVKQKGVEELRTTISEINEMLAVVKQLMPHTEKL